MKKLFKILLSVVLIGLMCLGLYGYKITHFSYNPDASAQHITETSHTKSKGLCAYYVRQAIEAGGCPTFSFPSSACDYCEFLLALDFEEFDKDDGLIPGDIVVFRAVDKHPHGHIAMWNGRQWISDFKQKSIIVNRVYRKSDATYYRMTQGKHSRKLFYSSLNAKSIL